MKDFNFVLYGAGALAALVLASLAAMHVIGGATLALFAALLVVSVTIARVMINGSTPQKSVASMLRDDVDAPRTPIR